MVSALFGLVLFMSTSGVQLAAAPTIVRDAHDARSPADAGGTWTELTTVPYDLEDRDHANYEQYFAHSGYGLSGGRIQALAVDGDTVYAGAGGGGVWRSLDRGKTWTPVTDDLPTLSSGDLAVDPTNGDVWYGTGEAAMGDTQNPGGRSYRGVGVFRSSDGGDTWDLIGGDQLDQTMIPAVELDGVGNIYAATTEGLYRRSISAPASEPWSLVLRPGTPGPYGFTFANDVVVKPGTDGRVVVASFGWPRADVDHNGFFVSHDYGQGGTWEPVTTRGDLDADQVGRASLAYSADGSRLYVVVGSWHSHHVPDDDRNTNLYGVFMSRSGAIAGPWTKIAGTRRLRDAEGSLTAINHGFALPGGGPNIYQSIGVDPTDRDHLYVGLSELYETVDVGRTWVAAGTQFCFKGSLDFCRTTTHGGQHAIVFGDGVVYAGNNGGVYRRRLTRHTVGGWVNLNRDLHALHLNAVGVGMSEEGDVIWGGTFDDGLALLRPGASSMIATHCCSIYHIIVDPSNPDRVAIEHNDEPVLITANGGLSGGFRDASPGTDPLPYGINHTLRADPLDPNRHWVFGGRYISETRKGWMTRCCPSGDWERLHDLGSGNISTALDAIGDTIYAGWCRPASCDPADDITTGIDANVGGEWHRIVGPGLAYGGDPLPDRLISAIGVDPADPKHVYVASGEYRNPWTSASRSGGHVFESTDGGVTWQDITGNLPAAAATDLLLVGNKLVLSTDGGVFVADAITHTMWSRLGTGIPNAAVTDLTLTPDGGTIIAATYGRGLWSIPAS